MRLIKKIFNKFFLLKIVLIIVLSLKTALANDANKSILSRLPTSIFAVVNNEAISIYDLIQRSTLFSISSRVPIDEEFELKVLPELISGYIDETIQAQEIKKNNITIDENQVKNMVGQIEKENGFKEGGLKDFLKQNKTEISILEKQIRTNIGWRQLVANKFRSQIVIQESEVENLHKRLNSSVGKEEFFVEQIFLSFENKKKAEVLNRINNIHKQILQGGDFTSISKQFSESFSGRTGIIGWIPEIDFETKILNEVKKLEINKPSKPLEGESGYFIINIKNKKIIGEDIISEVSLFQFQLLEENDETLSMLSNIKNCDELEVFSEKYASVDSGALGMFKYTELSNQLKDLVKKLNKNQISEPINIGSEKFQIMLCDIKKNKPIIPSKFKITEILTSRKLEIIGKQYMSELQTKAIIDIRI